MELSHRGNFLHKVDRPRNPPPVGHSVGLLFLYRALDRHPFFPSRVASGRCVLSLVLLLVSFPRSQSPVVGVPGLCWLWRVCA